MTKIPSGALVLVADGEKALLLVNRGDAGTPDLEVVRALVRENPPTREQGTDRPGRFSDAGSPSHRSAVEDTDWHRIGKERFAADLARRLDKAAQEGEFRQIVLVAPARVLGDLRRTLHDGVRRRVVAEVEKDLTGHPTVEIARILSDA